MVIARRELEDRLRRVTTLALDVDGVLTDGGVWWGANGEELKRFSFRDVMGLSLARKTGLRVALVSGEASAIVDRFATKLNINDVFKGCRDKRTAIQELMNRHRLAAEEICFIGDDINDLPAMEIVGVPVAVRDAAPALSNVTVYRARAAGGHGAVREVVEMLLEARKSEDAAQCALASHS